jgi:hypothetical protein
MISFSRAGSGLPGPLTACAISRVASGDEGPPYVGALPRLCLERARARMEADIKAVGFTDIQPTHFVAFSCPPPRRAAAI